MLTIALHYVSEGISMLEESTKLTKDFLAILPSKTPVTIVSYGESPDVVNTWSHYIRTSGDNTLLIPAAGMHSIENDVNQGKPLLLTFGSYDLPGSAGNGRGYHVSGTGEFQNSGKYFELMKNDHEWIRAVLVVHVNKVEQKI